MVEEVKEEVKEEVEVVEEVKVEVVEEVAEDVAEAAETCESAGFCSRSASAAMHCATSAWMSALTRSGSGSAGSTSMCRGGGYRIACSLPSFGGISRASA